MLRQFLSGRRALLPSALFTILLAATVVTQADAAAARTYVSGNAFLTLDGTQCGFIKSVDGGEISANVIEEAAGPTHLVKKHIGQPVYEPFILQVGFSMTRAVYEWIKSSWTDLIRKNGSIIYMDYSLNPTSQTNFSNAVITETTIPACDGSSKEPAYMTLMLEPEYTVLATPSPTTKTGEYGKNEQKMWLPSNFRLDIDGLDCSRVNKIDSFTVKRNAISVEIGNARDYVTQTSELVFPNLRITLAETTAKSWTDWFNDFVIKGNNDESKEKSGTLTLLSPNRGVELAKISFSNLGIFRIGPEKAEANASQIKRVVAELYCEKMVFEYLGKVVAETQQPPGARVVARRE